MGDENAYVKRRYTSFGEWLEENRNAANLSIRKLRDAIPEGPSRGTLADILQDRTPPGALKRKIPISYIEKVCRLMPGADLKEGMYLAGWMVERPQAPDDPLQIIAKIAAEAMTNIMQICHQYGVTPNLVQIPAPMLGRQTPKTASEEIEQIRLRYRSKDEIEAVRLR